MPLPPPALVGDRVWDRWRELFRAPLDTWPNLCACSVGNPWNGFSVRTRKCVAFPLDICALHARKTLGIWSMRLSGQPCHPKGT